MIDGPQPHKSTESWPQATFRVYGEKQYLSKRQIHQMFLDALESVRKAAPETLAALIELRVAGPESLLGDEVMVVPLAIADEAYLGPLGLINGIAVALGIPRVAACYNEAGNLIGFQTYQPPEEANEGSV